MLTRMAAMTTSTSSSETGGRAPATRGAIRDINGRPHGDITVESGVWAASV